MDLQGFNAQNVDPEFRMEAIPDGNYVCLVQATIEKPTKAGNGSFLEITWEVQEGLMAGRKLFSRLNLNNSNATAVKIAMSELSAICRAVGVIQPRSSTDFVGRRAILKVSLEERKDQPGQHSNRIDGYLSIPTMGSQGAPPGMAGIGGQNAAPAFAGQSPNVPVAPTSPGGGGPAGAGTPWNRSGGGNGGPAGGGNPGEIPY